MLVAVSNPQRAQDSGTRQITFQASRYPVLISTSFTGANGFPYSVVCAAAALPVSALVSAALVSAALVSAAWPSGGGGTAASGEGGGTASPLCTAMIRWNKVITLATASTHKPAGRMYGTPRPHRPVTVKVSTNRSGRSAIPTFAVVPRPSARALT